MEDVSQGVVSGPKMVHEHYGDVIETSLFVRDDVVAQMASA